MVSCNYPSRPEPREWFLVFPVPVPNTGKAFLVFHFLSQNAKSDSRSCLACTDPPPANSHTMYSRNVCKDQTNPFLLQKVLLEGLADTIPLEIRDNHQPQQHVATRNATRQDKMSVIARRWHQCHQSRHCDRTCVTSPLCLSILCPYHGLACVSESKLIPCPYDLRHPLSNNCINTQPVFDYSPNWLSGLYNYIINRGRDREKRGFRPNMCLVVGHDKTTRKKINN